MRENLSLAKRVAGVPLGVVWMCLFCDYVLMTMAIPIFPLLHTSDFMTGLLFAAKAICQICCSPLLSGLIDRHGKAIIMLGLALEISTLLMFSVTFSYDVWMLARGLSGVASAALVSAGFAQLQRAFPEQEERAMAMGLATTGIIAGVCLGPVFGGTLYELRPCLPFALLALLEAAVLAAVWLGLPQSSVGAVAEAEAGKTDGTTMVAMLKCREVAEVLGALMLANAAIACLESTTARYFMNTFDFTVGQVSLFYLFTSVPSCLVSGLAGPLANSFGARRVLGLGLALQGFFTLVGPKDVLGLEVASFVILGAGMGAVDGTSPAILGQLADSKFGGTGKIYLMSNIAVQSGFVIGPILGNAVVEVGGFSCGMFVMGAALFSYALLFSAAGTGASGVSKPLLQA
mmetsp:Transcript_30502/g.87431  ORF Transcript_30502/g.87431 Transcript_30502/m.87431 type:complete len:403 (-) Transcript_30502:92-1300(-)